MRAPYQILVFPFIRENGKFFYAIFKREDHGYWQGIAGGGEDGETPLESAKREAEEEAGISPAADYIRLASVATMSAANTCGLIWGEDMPVIPEYAFGVEVVVKELRLSHEHAEYKWLEFKEAAAALKWDSNRNALWELNYRLEKGRPDSGINRGSIGKFYA